MASNITNFLNLTKIQTSATHLMEGQNETVLDLPLRAFFSVWKACTVSLNCLAILVCYVYLKNFRRHSMVLVGGYVSLFRIFSEFIGAAVCVCYGILELEPNYIVVGSVGIATGLCFRGLVLYFRKCHHPRSKLVIRIGIVMYISCVILSCFHFYDILEMIGAFSCASRIMTCVLPLAALADSLRCVNDTLFFLGTEGVAVCFIWWYCSHLSFKYFVVVPTIIGLIFNFIQYALEEIYLAVEERCEREK